ncbi:uncharacterized protein [Magallana gigas]|uniref:uncharacterized protein n=1 Tax=Magallana gigas TaxID=29159 RepID=UPI00333F661D
MKFRNTVYCTVLLFLCNMGETVGLLTHGNTVNFTDTNPGFPGYSANLADMMQMLLNQTTEIENLKQQSTNDRTTIQSLQNRVFFLEAELNKLNVSKLPSSQEFSTYLKSINQLTQNLAANEASDKNISQRLNDAVQVLDDLKLKDMSSTQLLLNQSVELEQQSAKDRYSIHLLQNETQRLVRNLDDLKVQVRYTSLSLLDVHSMTEELNGSLVQRLEERISDVHDHITNVSKRIGFTATVSTSSISWNSGTLVFDVVITNVGNGYNPSTGVFTAPTAGEYVFFVNVQSYNINSIYVDVVLNGVTKVRTMAYTGGSDYFDAGPNLVVLTLQKGDRVWVKYFSGQGYHINGPITTFSGFLL